MKKYFCYIISLLLVVSLIGCGSKKVSDNTSKDNFDINEAINISKEYINNIIDGNPSKNNELLSEDASDKGMNVDIKSDLVITNYDVYEYNELGKSTMVKAYVSRNKKDSPYASVETMSIKVIKDDDEYKIDKVVSSAEREVYVYGTAVKYRNKDDIKTKVVLRTKNLPEFAFDKYVSANSIKVQVERNSFNNIALSISGETLAVSTYKDNSYIFIVNIKQTQETAVGDNKGQQGQQGDSQGQGQTDEAGEKEEKYIGNNIKEAGILFNKKAEMMTFSTDGKHLVVQYTSSNENSISIYDVKNNEEVYLGLDKTFDFSKVNLSILNVKKNSVNIKATKKDNIKDEDVEDMVGVFSIDFDKFEVEKI